MGSFNFWQKWLLVFGLYLVFFGFLLSFFSDSILMDYLFNNQINPEFWGLNELPEKVIKFQAWIYAVLGSVIVGWGILISFIAYYPFKAKQKWAWNCIAFGFVTWFLIDSVMSVYFQIYFNLFVNLVFLLLVLLPLIFTRKYFVNKEFTSSHQ